MELIVMRGEEVGGRMQLTPAHIVVSELLSDFAKLMPGQPFTIHHPKVTFSGVLSFLFFENEDDCIFLEKLWAAEYLCTDLSYEKSVIVMTIRLMKVAHQMFTTLREKTLYVRESFERRLSTIVSFSTLNMKKRRRERSPIFQWSALFSFLPPSFADKVYRELRRQGYEKIHEEIKRWSPRVIIRFSQPIAYIGVSCCSCLKDKHRIKWNYDRFMNVISKPFFNTITGRLEKQVFMADFGRTSLKRFNANRHNIDAIDYWEVTYRREDATLGRKFIDFPVFDHLQDVWFKSFERSPFDL